MEFETERDSARIEDEFREMLIAIVRRRGGDDVEECVQELKHAALGRRQPGQPLHGIALGLPVSEW